MAKKLSPLGRGLDTLLSSTPVVRGSSSISEIEIEKIVPNPDQPRTFFDESALEELSNSIKQIGIITPITLKNNNDGTYQIIAGERRFRAAKQAGLQKLPAYIKTEKDENVLEMALIENIQREDLNSIEIALAYQNLLEQNDLTQEELSERVGKKRATVANYLRLLKLPADVQMGIKDKKIDMGHARALVSMENPADQITVYEEILQHNYSVRQTEERIRNFAPKQPKKSAKTAFPQAFEVYKNELETLFSSRAKISCNDKGKGKITIDFASEEELFSLINSLKSGVNEK